jgi:hypothetical protein
MNLTVSGPTRRRLDWRLRAALVTFALGVAFLVGALSGWLDCPQ